jgi:hypothetical protein
MKTLVIQIQAETNIKIKPASDRTPNATTKIFFQKLRIFPLPQAYPRVGISFQLIQAPWDKEIFELTSSNMSVGED